jgi:hypothetical protein
VHDKAQEPLALRVLPPHRKLIQCAPIALPPQ